MKHVEFCFSFSTTLKRYFFCITVLINRCAGEIAAVPNTYCAVGVAYGAKVSGNEL